MAQLLIISGYLFLLLLLGIGASRLFRGTSQDYMLASHSIGPFPSLDVHFWDNHDCLCLGRLDR